MSIVFCDLVQFALFVLILKKMKLQGSEILQAHRMVQKTKCCAENLDVLLLKIFSIGIYFANLKEKKLTQRAFYEGIFFPGREKGEKVCGISLFNMTSVE